MMEWISVKDRLPEDNLIVLFAYAPGTKYVRMGFYRKNEGWHLLTGILFSRVRLAPEQNCYVTHWMCLPEPPKEE